MSGPTVVEASKVPGLRGYELRRLRVPIGGEVVSLVVPDAAAWRRGGSWADAVERGAEPPYWTRVWLAAVAAARWLARVRGLAQATVCDLGCGLGLPGMVAMRQGARVTFVDREPDALAFAAWNAAQQARGPVPQTVALDWAKRELEGSFEVLVLSDVSYHSAHHEPLLGHLHRCLATAGVVLHADPLREEASKFLAQAGQRFASASCRRDTSLGDDAGVVRLWLGAKDPGVLEDWMDRSGGRLWWETGG